MKLRTSTGSRLCFTAAAFLLAFTPLAAQQSSGSQPSKGTPAKPQSQGSEVRVEKFHVKQEFGPQSASRRGETTTTATPPPAQNTGSHPDTLKVKQEFGPQTAARRGDRMTVVTPPVHGNAQGGTAQSSTSSTTNAKPAQPAPKPGTHKPN